MIALRGYEHKNGYQGGYAVRIRGSFRRRTITHKSHSVIKGHNGTET